MIGNQCPSKASGGGLEQDGAHTTKEIVPILVVKEDSTTLNPTADDMVQSPGSVYA